MKFAFLLLIVLALAGNISRADEMNIASVDIRKIFDAWDYSIASQKKVAEIKDTLEKENNDRLAVISRYQMERSKLHQTYKQNQKTMSEADKKAMDLKFRSLGRDALALEQDRRDFSEKEKRILANEISSQSKLILDQISQTVQVYALEKKYHMVIEMGGNTTRNVPLFVHLDGAVDITENIIKRLNETEGE